VRLTYEPRVDDPNSKYLRLESIGRVGTIDPNDPTTFGNSERAGLRRELLAYKSIGINEYVRFVTNKNRKPDAAPFGANRLVRDFPAPNVAARDANTVPPPAPELRDIISEYAGPIRVNGDAVFYGENYFTLVPGRNDVIEIAGRLLLNGANAPAPNPGSQVGQPIGRVFVRNASLAGSPFNPVAPSDNNFDALGGLVRDGVPNVDIRGVPRSVARLEPPVIDLPVGPGGATRYRLLTRNAPPLSPADTNNAPVSTDNGLGNIAGVVGWGTGMYLNNPGDVQRASALLPGAFSLRSDWLQPGSVTARRPSWIGDFQYTPPAVLIELFPRYMRITQTIDDPTTGRFRRCSSGRTAAGSGPPARSSAIPTTARQHRRPASPPVLRAIRSPGIRPEGTPMVSQATRMTTTSRARWSSSRKATCVFGGWRAVSIRKRETFTSGT
jgi:hypothetical protein